MAILVVKTAGGIFDIGNVFDGRRPRQRLLRLHLVHGLLVFFLFATGTMSNAERIDQFRAVCLHTSKNELVKRLGNRSNTLDQSVEYTHGVPAREEPNLFQKLTYRRERKLVQIG